MVEPDVHCGLHGFSARGEVAFAPTVATRWVREAKQAARLRKHASADEVGDGRFGGIPEGHDKGIADACEIVSEVAVDVLHQRLTQWLRRVAAVVPAVHENGVA